MDLHNRRPLAKQPPRKRRGPSMILAGDFIAITLLILVLVPLLHEATKNHVASLFRQGRGGVIIDRKPVPPEQSAIFVAGSGRIEVAHVDPRDGWANVGLRLPFHEWTELVTYASTRVARDPNRYFVVVVESGVSWSELSVVLDALIISKVKHFRFAHPDTERTVLDEARCWLTIQPPGRDRIASISFGGDA